MTSAATSHDREAIRAERRLDACFVAVLLFFLLVIYWPVTRYPFTNWDEATALLANPLLNHPSWQHVVRLLSPGGVSDEKLFIPLTYLSFLADTALFGMRSGPMHLENLLLHGANALLLYGLVRLLTGRRLPATLTAVAFAVHPLQVESVAWVMGRKDLLATGFALLCLLASERAREGARRHGWARAGALLAGTAAMLAKPVMVVLPALMPLTHLARHGRPTRRDLLHCIPYVVVACLVVYLTPRQLATARAVPPFLYRVAMLPWVAWHWILRLALLAKPSPLYPWPAYPPAAAAYYGGAAAILVALLVLLAVLWRRRQTAALAALAFAAVAALPALTIVLRYERFVTADRYGYFPLAGVFLAVALSIDRLAFPARRTGVGLATLWLVLAGALACRQVRIWRSSEALWTSVLREHPASAVANSNLGMAYLEAGDRAAAIRQFEHGLAARPDHRDLLLNLGRARLDNGETETATALLQRLVSIVPDDARAWRTLGDAYAAQEQGPKALDAYCRSIELNAEEPSTYASIGAWQWHRGQLQAAVSAYERAVVLAPTRADWHYNLGLLYQQQGHNTEAAMAFREAVDRQPGLVNAQYNLGVVLARLGRLDEAETAYRAALRKAPERAEIRVNLAAVRLQRGAVDEAEALLQQALRLDPKPTVRAGILYNLGLVYLARAQTAKATEAFSAAIRADAKMTAAHLELARLALAEGDRDAARRHASAVQAAGGVIPPEMQQKLETQTHGTPP